MILSALVLLGGLHPTSVGDALDVLKRLRPEVQWDARTVVSADIDCDGRVDRAVLGRNGRTVYVAVMYAGSSLPDILDFAVDPAVQQGICAVPVKLAIESLDYDPTESLGEPLEGFQRSRRCKGLVLMGGACDSVHLFWNQHTKHLDWWRL